MKSNRCITVTSFTILLIAAATINKSLADYDSTVSDVINGIERLESSKHPYTVTCTTESLMTNLSVNNEPSICRAKQAWDGNRFDAIITYSDIHNGVEGLPERTLRHIWDSKRYISRQSITLDGLTHQDVFTSTDTNSPSKFLTGYEIGSFLNGYIQSMPLTDLLKKATSSALLDKKEMLDGAPCYVVEGKGSYGKYKMWIDVETHLLRRAVLDQEAGDLYYGSPLPNEFVTKEKTLDAMQSVHTEIGGVTIQKVDGVWAAVSGTQTTTMKYRVGKSEILQRKSTLSELSFHPDFSASNYFKMDGIPDGTRVHTFDSNEYMKYVWNNGRLEFDQTKDVIRAVDDAISTITTTGRKPQSDVATMPTSTVNRERDSINTVSTTVNRVSTTSWLFWGIFLLSAGIIITVLILRTRQESK